MDPYLPPSKNNAESRTVSAWTSRLSAAVVGLLTIQSLLQAATVAWVTFRLAADSEWPASSVGLIFIGLFVFRCVVAALYFVKFRWFYWAYAASVVAVYLVPFGIEPDIANPPVTIALFLIAGAIFAIDQRQYLFPWKR